MSEVNQAFLRAYLKNRASQTRESVPNQAAINEMPASSHPQGMHQAGFSSSPQPRQIPVATTIRQSSPGVRPTEKGPSDKGPTEGILPGTRIEQPMRSAPLGEHMRVDASHGAMRSQPATTAPSASTAVPQSQLGRGGVWSPIGVERGMKAMESSKASPAIVRNGVEAVSSESAIQRRAHVQPSHPPVPAPHLAQNQFAVQPSQYNPIQYVDGLREHVDAAQPVVSRTSDQALSEIAQPIAFGTGTATGRSRPSDILRETVPPRERSDSGQVRSDDSPIYRRIDQAHLAPKNMPAAAPAVAPAPVVVESNAQSTPVAAPISTHVDRRVAADSPELKAANGTAAAASSLPLPVAFAPSWEVDCFLWPEVVKQIERSHADAFRQIGKHLCTANRDGLKVMAITSGERGVGRSTVAMHMARSAAASGLKVALVEGDAFCPSLIDQLRLDVEHGWADCLFENVPLHEAAVHSIQDGITLFPLKSVISAQELHANLHRMAKLIKRISTLFDIVFIDANRLNLEQRDLVGVSQESVIDAAIVVVDTELSIKEKVDSAVSILQNMGLSSIGLVENFQS
jgi:Mrp family chromosome partitioning ATPase